MKFKIKKRLRKKKTVSYLIKTRSYMKIIYSKTRESHVLVLSIGEAKKAGVHIYEVELNGEIPEGVFKINREFLEKINEL